MQWQDGRAPARAAQRRAALQAAAALGLSEPPEAQMPPARPAGVEPDFNPGAPPLPAAVPGYTFTSKTDSSGGDLRSFPGVGNTPASLARLGDADPNCQVSRCCIHMRHEQLVCPRGRAAPRRQAVEQLLSTSLAPELNECCARLDLDHTRRPSCAVPGRLSDELPYPPDH